MTPDWSDFLRRRGARLSAGMVTDFGDPASERLAAARSSVLADVSHLAVIEVSGNDADSFLQGQITCDVRGLAPGGSTLGAWCSPKGRMLVDFFLARTAQGFLVLLPRSLAEAIRKRLQMFVLRAKVTIADASDRWVVLGLSGREAGAARAAAAAHLESAVLVALPRERCLVAVPAAQAEAAWESLAATLKPVGTPCWRWLDIAGGIPVIGPATQDKLVPQMANLDALGGVSFDKGCYTGQEVIARTRYLGKVKRRMYRARVPDGAEARPGDELFSEDLGEQANGLVVDAQPSPDGGCELLAVVQIQSRENSVVHLGSPSGPVLDFLPLPYELPAS